jgi:hypothetical protein
VVEIKRLELREKVKGFLGGIALSEFYGIIGLPIGILIGVQRFRLIE